LNLGSGDRVIGELLPLFPLPTVVLFPNVFLPLHIFEPRYRQMTADALAADRVIGMVLLRPGWERDYEGRPPVFPVGCSGVITHVEHLPDGRYTLVLRGVERFRIVREDGERPYRRAAVDPLPDSPLSAEDRRALHEHRAKLESILVDRAGANEAKIPPSMPDDDLVNALAQYLDLEPLEKQALLEQPCLRSRAASLVELLEMKLMIARTPGLSNVAH
jgi:Lon protease-like protein